MAYSEKFVDEAPTRATIEAIPGALVLEFGTPGRDVSWENRAAGVRYIATLRDEPLPAAQSRCRVLLLLRLPAGAPAATPLTARRDVERFVACDTGGGAWAFR